MGERVRHGKPEPACQDAAVGWAECSPAQEKEESCMRWFQGYEGHYRGGCGAGSAARLGKVMMASLLLGPRVLHCATPLVSSHSTMLWLVGASGGSGSGGREGKRQTEKVFNSMLALSWSTFVCGLQHNV